jgi:hypothetical protein
MFKKARFPDHAISKTNQDLFIFRTSKTLRMTGEDHVFISRPENILLHKRPFSWGFSEA